jgi:probable HAF family extracellular repeat protein
MTISAKRLLLPLAVLAAGVATAVTAEGPPAAKGPTRYHIRVLSTNGGAVSRGNSVNDDGLVAGYSNLADGRRHATAWFQGLRTDLGTLGGPNSSVAWPVKNTNGLIAGIAQTTEPEPVERWSCATFLAGSTGFTCRGVVWEWGAIRALPLLGGRNSFATGANDRGQVVGWSETDTVGSDCDTPQVFDFLPVVWGPEPDRVRALPLITGDRSGAATALNERGQVVGISGECDQAEGRHTAKHAVLWEKGRVIDIGGELPAAWWNTPMAINEHGVVVGFAGDPSDEEGNILHAFVWRKGAGSRLIPKLAGDTVSLANGINRRGQVVGSSCGASGCRAFVWEHGAPANLNDLRANPTTDVLINAQDINDEGVITGRVQTAAGLAAYVATPVR